MNPMNIIEYAEGLQARMKQELDNLNAEQDEIIKIGKTLTFIRGLITELKAFTRNYKFQSQTEEIQFFKEVKPVFLSQYFYYKKVFAIQLFNSFKAVKSRQSNYYQMLEQLERFIKKNREFYEYSLTGSTHLDEMYFTRNNHVNLSLNRDEKFSTGYDTILAKILSVELLKKFILSNLLKSEGAQTRSSPALTWTGSKTDLIEMIYALQYSESLNNGSADIKLIASTFENLFNVSLGDYYRIFLNIRLRKNSTTSFLDMLKQKLHDRIDDLNQA